MKNVIKQLFTGLALIAACLDFSGCAESAIDDEVAEVAADGGLAGTEQALSGGFPGAIGFYVATIASGFAPSYHMASYTSAPFPGGYQYSFPQARLDSAAGYNNCTSAGVGGATCDGAWRACPAPSSLYTRDNDLYMWLPVGSSTWRMWQTAYAPYASLYNQLKLFAPPGAIVYDLAYTSGIWQDTAGKKHIQCNYRVQNQFFWLVDR